MSTENRFGQFLKIRRSQIAPRTDTGTQVQSHRRVPGLRREEVAMRAGVSADYYTRLEQGRHKRPSESVLHALAAALELDELETRHLFNLAHSLVSPNRSTTEPAQSVRSSLLGLLESFAEHPAFIRGRRTEVLAMNPLAAELLADFPARPPGQRSLIRWAFLDPEAWSRYVDWERIARSMVGTLRLDAGLYPHDTELSRLVGDLSVHSAQFRTWWADHEVVERRDGLKRLEHPLVGRIDIVYEALNITGAEDQTLFIYRTEPGSQSESRLRTLASWAQETDGNDGVKRLAEASGAESGNEPET